MKNITIEINDELLEKKLISITDKSKKSLNQFIIDLLYSYLNEIEDHKEIKYNKLDPQKHMYKLHFVDIDDDLQMTNPFSD
jgi:hypothetical protein